MPSWVNPLLLCSLLCLTFSITAQDAALQGHAAKTPDSLVNNLPVLVDYLITPTNNEQEKAWVLYSWLTRYLTYDYEASRMDRRLNRNLSDILKRKKGVCFDYALLYEQMCRLAGLACFRVDGYANPQMLAKPIPASPDHSWNAVRLNDSWYLVDATWGNVPDQLSTEYQISYFLTPPELFILNHLPSNPVWQLLPCPITTEVFEGGPLMISQTISNPENCNNKQETSLSDFLSLSRDQQHLLNAELTYATHPTKENYKYYAHALADWSVHLSQKADSLQLINDLTGYISMNQEAIKVGEQAFEILDPHDWQIEYYAERLINQAVAYSRIQNGSADIELAIDLLEKAQEILLKLPEDGYYRQYAMQQCDAFLEILKDE